MATYAMLWKFRLAGSAAQNHEDSKRLPETFAKWQPPESQNWLQFLQRVDGQGGMAVIEADDPASLLGEIAKFDTWAEFDLVPVVDVMDSVPLLGAAIDFRESI